MIKIVPKPNSTQSSFDCLGVVLSGGQSSRMGKDKAGLMRNNENMLAFSQQVLAQTGVCKTVISTNSEKAHFGTPDLISNAGPLGGVYSVISQYKPKALLILPVDLPLITASVLEKLRLTGELNQKACFYEDNYLPLYLPVNSFTELFFKSALKNFNGKGPSIRAMLKQVPHQTLSLDNKNALFNTNTPEEWQQAKQTFIK